MHVPDKVDEIKGAVALLIATLTALWGWMGWAVVIWVACIFLDYGSGTAAARKRGEWSSAVAREGLWHKLGEIFAVLVAALCDIALDVVLQSSGIAVGIEIGPIITPVVLLWYIITELGSIIENAGLLGAPIPVWLQKSLKDYRKKIDASQGVEEGEEIYTGKHERETAPEDKPPDADPEPAAEIPDAPKEDRPED